MTESASFTAFRNALAKVAAEIGDKPLDGTLQAHLNAVCGPGSELFDEIDQLVQTGAAEGWLCEREHGGIKFGRPIKPNEGVGSFSVDVVDMENVVGPHHAHPTGEIDMIMPREGDAKFDGAGRGWHVYEAGSAHKPTVDGGRAHVLYLLPEGAIDFTR